MASIHDFEDFYAESAGQSRAAFRLDETYNDDEYRYNPYFVIKIYGVPSDLSDFEAEQILSGDKEGSVLVATLSGNIVMNGAMIRKGFDPIQMCDDYSAPIGYAMRALTEDGAPLSDELALDMCNNIFYIYEFTFEEDFRDSEFMTDILLCVPDILTATVNVYPDMLVFYPTPLPYEPDLKTKIERGIAQMAYNESIERLNKQLSGEEIIEDGKPHLILSERQLNYMMGTRNEGDTYPASAKDTAVWEVYENAGFSEVGNSRLLYMWVDKMGE